MEVTLTNLDLSRPLLDTLNTILEKAENWGTTLIASFQKKELAEELGKSTRTVSRNLSTLEEQGYIFTTTKHGNKGGTVVGFSKDVVNLVGIGNPITGTTKELEKIRETLYPSPNKKPPKKRYRSKQAIAEEKLAIKKEKEKERLVNDRIEKEGVRNEDTFKELDDAEVCMKAYILSRMFNAYSVLYFKEQAEGCPEDSQERRAFLRTASIYTTYESMSGRFVGTQTFSIFKSLVSYFTENNINPLAYFTAQFSYVSYLSSICKVRKNAIPYIPSLVSDVAKAQYDKAEEFIERMRATTSFYNISKEKAPIVGSDYPIIQGLSYTYQFGSKSTAVEQALEDLALIRKQDADADKLATFYEHTRETIKQAKLSSEEEEAITHFLDNQVANFVDKGSLSVMHYTLAFPLQIMHAHAIAKMNEISDEQYFMTIGNRRRMKLATQEEVTTFIENGSWIEDSLVGQTGFINTIYFLSQYLGLYVHVPMIREILTAHDDIKIPLDATGMLDINSLLC